ncbi:hypothetical protein QGM71_02985 [Virgibacillus sp. C22-A2]|uniref:ABC transporter periplasmic binding protein yphF n=1 Tax=Virgibacillus tibetensis TaxID=3042313 RepID=A0ABU6KBN3_9BACI|nr:hypothetical protein [Virgibacillus sp. C22-A2]
MNSTYIKLCLTLLCIVMLSGCLYPQSELSKNQAPNETQLEIVQNAVEAYREEKQGLVPIKTKMNDTPIFQKYLIDFTALKELNVLSELPGNAYENGGIYQYTIITPDENPRVKLIDLRITEAIRSVNVQLEIYRSKHTYPPFKAEIEDGIYSIDFEKLGFDSTPTAVSPYSRENLPIVMDVNGNLYIDYRIDLNQALEEYDHTYAEGDDIRYILAENTPFVPAYSLPYTIKDGEPVFLPQNN